MGRGDEEVYQFLLKRYQEASDEEEKLDLIVALGMLHDERLLPVLVQDLRDTHSDATHAATTLNALREMDAPMVIDADSGNVTITGYGEIKDVVPEWWNPEEEEDDTEDSGESDDELTDEDDGIDLDELFPDIDDAEENISVDVEDAVAPSDPAVNKTGFGPLRVEHIGRNDPCPCGSGKKFKHCHGKNA
jgi:HEAT repeat protein